MNVAQHMAVVPHAQRIQELLENDPP